MLAPLVDAYFGLVAAEPRKAATILAEIRLNEAKIGATSEDRLRLRWTIAPDADSGKPSARRGPDPRLRLVPHA